MTSKLPRQSESLCGLYAATWRLEGDNAAAVFNASRNSCGYRLLPKTTAGGNSNNKNAFFLVLLCFCLNQETPRS